MAADPKQQNIMNLEEQMRDYQYVTFWGFGCKGIRHQASAAHIAYIPAAQEGNRNVMKYINNYKY